MVSKPKIMVVEDTYLVARDIQDTLTSLGYFVTDIVETGKEAVEKAKSSAPDLVLMDIKLKGNMDGIEAASQIHEILDIPIIYLTALSDDYTLLRAKRTEPSGYIIKPFNKADLHSSIEMALYKYKMENFIKDREELLSTTLKSISDAVITTDSNGYITFMNSNAEQLTGWQQEEIIGKHIDSVYTLVNEKTGEKTPNPYQQVINQREIVELKNQLLKTRAGRDIPVTNINDPIMDDQGAVIGTVVSLRDISEQKKLQSELAKAQKLEAIALRAKSIGHEFNNLLTVIRGNIDLLRHSLDQNHSAQALLIDADKAAVRATNLTNQFIAFSKDEGMIKRPEPFPDLIKGVANSILSDSSIRCSFAIPEDTWLMQVDKGQINQVLYTIIKIIYNSIDDSGEIKISAENTEITEKDMFPLDPGKYIKIVLRGHSAVIPGDLFKQLFDPYFTNAEQNDGLELASSYSIIKNHEGYISVESTLESGTIFYIFLPAATGESRKIEKEGVLKTVEGEKRILVMDDQELVRIIVGKMLSFMGFEVEFARHGVEAVDIYQQAIKAGDPFDCVILDLTIPWGLGARETIIKLMEIDPEVKAIVSTGYSNDPSIYNYKELGFKGVIKKPYELQELSSLLKNLLGK